MSRVFFVFKKLLLWVEDGERKKVGVQNAKEVKLWKKTMDVKEFDDEHLLKTIVDYNLHSRETMYNKRERSEWVIQGHA